MDGNLLANVMENQCICKQIANIFAKMSEKRMTAHHRPANT